MGETVCAVSGSVKVGRGSGGARAALTIWPPPPSKAGDMDASGPSYAKATEVHRSLGEGGRAGVLTRAREGDDEAFGALVQQHSRRVYQLAFRMTGNEQDAEDVVQESFLRAYRQLGRFESRADFGTWLYRITANCAVDMMRTRGHR